MDNLCLTLSQAESVCGRVVHHHLHTEDIVLFACKQRGLQKLLHTSITHGCNHEIELNSFFDSRKAGNMNGVQSGENIST